MNWAWWYTLWTTGSTTASITGSHRAEGIVYQV
jgi:hypothetical protein